MSSSACDTSRKPTAPSPAKHKLRLKARTGGSNPTTLDRLAFQQAQIPIAVLDAGGVVHRANPALAGLFGKPVAELVGSHLGAIPAEVLSRVQYSDGPVVHESCLPAVDESRVVSWSLQQAVDRGSDATLIVATGHEITDRRREQEKARLTEARLQATLILSRMCMADQSRIYEYTLGQAIELTRSRVGFVALVDREAGLLEIPAWTRPAEAEQVIGHRPLICRVDSADSWAETARTGHTLIVNEPLSRDMLKRDYPGDHGPLRRQLSVPVISDGELVMIAGVADREDDYTESEARLLTLLMEDLWMVIQRQRAQQELEASEERYRLLVDNMSEGLAIFDIDFKITYGNDSLGRMLGYAPEEVTQLTLAAFLDESGLEIFYDQMARRRVKASAPHEMQWYARSGRKIPALVAPQPLFDQKGNFVGGFAVLTDISQQKQVEEKLQQANESLAAEQRSLMEKNIALKEIMSQIEGEKKAVQSQLQSNVDRIILPLLRTLRSKVGDDSCVYVDLAESCLVDITSPFVNRLERRFGSLSPRETEICNMIKAGLSSKDIAEALHTSVHTVHNQRKQIRRKLGLAGSDANLSSYLNSLAQ